MPWKKDWISFSEARKIVVEMRFASYREFEQWKKRPPYIPANPRAAYPYDWGGREYWLGIGPFKESSRPKQRVQFLPFEEARSLAQQLMQKYGIINQSQWHAWVKTMDRPAEIPADPSKSYKSKGWIGWPHWFGQKPARASGREVVKPFLEAREFVRSLNLKSSDDWYAWAKSNRPDDVPYSPDTRYRDEGWIDWGDFLGFRTRWSHQGIVNFLESLKPCIEHLTELDLYLILSKNGMLRRDARLRGGKLLRGIKHARTPDELERAKEQITAELEVEQGAENPDGIVDDVGRVIAVDELEHEQSSSLRQLDILEALRAVDRVAALQDANDPDVLDFMVNERISMLWQEVMTSGESALFSRLGELQDGSFAVTIRESFGEQFQNVKSLPVPDGYRMLDGKHQPVELNLMQRLTAYRLQHEKRIGNWSGVGAGKTNAAIFASAVIDARMTLIVAANSTIKNWKTTISRAFDEGAIHIHDQKPLEFRFERGKRNFVVVNYESFQRPWTGDFIRRVIEQARIDFIVFDEVQLARQRHAAESRMSERRKQINSLIQLAIVENPDLRILAMSATPVVNNLREAVKVLELLWPEKDFTHIPVGTSTANAVGVHMQLRQHGVRYVPRYDQVLEKRTVAIDGYELCPRLEKLLPQELLEMEQIILEAKLRDLGNWVRRGTLIYTHYVEGMVVPLTKAVEQLGLRVRHFTGREKTAVREFVDEYEANAADVLIGSAPVGTGVDGLQFVLDRIVFISLPWSHAEYEQIVGRLWRQGSRFQKVEVIIPQVTLREERAGLWSWDDLRLRGIEYKQTLADAALDGVIPKGGLPSREEMQRRSLEALKVWIEKVSKGLPQTTPECSAVTSPSAGPVPKPVP